MSDSEQFNLDKILNADPLFGEKRLKEIAESLSEEDKQRYAKIGEEMYLGETKWKENAL